MRWSSGPEFHRSRGVAALLVRWHGHSCFEIVMGSETGSSYVMDPHDGISIGIKRPAGKADIITVSHDHFDHDRVAVFASRGTKIFRKPGRFFTENAEILGIKTYHDRDHGKKRGKNTVFQITIRDFRIVHLGDIGHPLSPEHTSILAGADIMFIPVGGIFTIDAGDALEIIRALMPRLAVPMHYALKGLSFPLADVEDFLSLVKDEFPIIRTGHSHEFGYDGPQNRVSGNTEITVFSLE